MTTSAIVWIASTAWTAWVRAWHLGPLHPVEQALTLTLAFGPFVLLGIVIAVRRRQDAAAEESEQRGGAQRER